jgi:hypothetical protein
VIRRLAVPLVGVVIALGLSTGVASASVPARHAPWCPPGWHLSWGHCVRNYGYRGPVRWWPAHPWPGHHRHYGPPRHYPLVHRPVAHPFGRTHA